MVAINCNKLSIPMLRWCLFSKFQSDIGKRPPTVAALKFKFFHSDFIAVVPRRDSWNFQQLPSFDKIVALMTDKLPAPLALVESSVCNCATLWNNNRCKCNKNNLLCTDMCKCIGFQNEDESENY